MTKICSQCGVTNAVAAKFCKECGTSLAPEPVPPRIPEKTERPSAAVPDSSPRTVARPTRMPWIVAAVVFVLLVAGAAFWLTQRGANPAASAAAPAATAPTQPEPTPPAAQSPGSGLDKPPAAAPMQAAPAEPSYANATPGPAPVPVPVAKQTRRSPQPLPAAVVPQAVAPAPKPLIARPAPELHAAPVPVPQAPAEAAPSSPREACGKRVFLAMIFCISEQCEKPQFKNHPQCVEMREQDRRRQEEQNNR